LSFIGGELSNLVNFFRSGMFLYWRRCFYWIGSVLSFWWWTRSTKKFKVLE